MIKFKEITAKNFLSVGNQGISLRLDDKKSILIIGRNGSGKSLLVTDAISFVLYGKPFRKINKPQLINSINQTHLLVEIDIDIGNNSYRIIRGLKPAIFEIYENGKLINQSSTVVDYQNYLEKYILKMSYSTFKQVVVLGKTVYEPFMKLNLAKRRDLIEDLLNLKVFTNMRWVVKDKQAKIEEKLQKLQTDILPISTEILFREEKIQELKTQVNSTTDDINKQIENKKKELRIKEAELSKLNDRRESLLNEKNELNETVVKNAKRKLDNELYSIKKEIGNVKDKIDGILDIDLCPVCLQSVGDAHKDNVIKSLRGSAKELKIKFDDITVKTQAVNSILDKLEIVKKSISEIEKEMVDCRNNISFLRKEVDILTKNKEIAGADNELLLQAEFSEINKLEKKRGILQQKIDKCLLNLEYYATIANMLKDTGLKSVIIKKYIPIFNEIINSFLEKLGVHISFTLDENFNERILSRYRDGFSYNSFSEGEKLRIDLAFMLSWRELSKIKNSVSTNLLVMDEVFDSSLDQSGVDAFVKLLPELDNNLIVVSHTPEKIIAYFDKVVNVFKNGNFTEIEIKEDD